MVRLADDGVDVGSFRLVTDLTLRLEELAVVAG